MKLEDRIKYAKRALDGTALGDRDTICAMVGGMVSLYADDAPQEWLNYMEYPEDSEFMAHGSRKS